MLRRSFLALAILTALMGAPSSVLVARHVGAQGTAQTAMFDQVILVGLAGIAAVALIGTILLLAARRRSKREGATPAVGIDPEALERRAKRRRGEVPDDPTLSAIGAGRSRRGATDRGGRAERAVRRSGRGRRTR